MHAVEMNREQALLAAHARARQSCPTVELSAERYAAFVRERLAEAVPEGEIAADLYLACACSHGDEGALSAFDSELMSQVGSFLSRVDSSPAVIDEVRQRVRERLFVSKDGAPPKIAEYGGRGRLASWLRVVCIRTALNLKTSDRSGQAPENAADVMLADHDPELDYLRARYQHEFQEAFVNALASLDARDRTLLRLNLVEGLNIESIGQTYGVHRATVARWIAQARDRLFEATRDALHQRLGLSATEFASLVRLVRSQLDVSICRILSEQDEAG